MPTLKQEGERIDGIAIPEINAPIDVIIGSNHYDLYEPHLSTTEKTSDGRSYRMAQSLIGCVAYRIIDSLSRSEQAKCMIAMKNVPIKEAKLSINDERLADKFDEEVRITNDKIVAPMLMIEDGDESFCDRATALNRLRGQLKSFARNPQREEEYDKKMAEYLDNGYAIDKPDDLEIRNYIPHHGVTTSSKFRVVFAFNAVGKNRRSLNDEMATGLRLLNDIRAILVQLRTHKFFASADIKAMFHQIMMALKHLPLCGFLYWRKVVKKTMSNVSEFVMAGHTFGAKDSPFIACRALQRTIEKSEHLAFDEKTTVKEKRRRSRQISDNPESSPK